MYTQFGNGRFDPLLRESGTKLTFAYFQSNGATQAPGIDRNRLGGNGYSKFRIE